MPSAKQLTADALFVLQIGLALISGGSQFLRLLTTSQGVNVSWLASWLTFLVINLALTIRAHRTQPSRVTLQTVLTYTAWTAVIAAVALHNPSAKVKINPLKRLLPGNCRGTQAKQDQ